MVDMARGPVVIRRRLGAALKRYRHQSGLDLSVVAKELEVSPAKLSRLETGQVAPKLRDVRDLIDLYGVAHDDRETLMHWADDARGQGWWQPITAEVSADLNLYYSLEAEARLLQSYSHITFSGLLQTENYAEMLLNGVSPQHTRNQLLELLDIRQRRPAVLSRGDDSEVASLVLDTVFHEAALHCGPPTGTTMKDQLNHLLTMSKKPNITVRMFPYEKCFTKANSPFAIFTPRLPEDGIVVNVESTGSDAYLDTDAEVSRYQAIWTSVTDHVLDEKKTREAIETALSRLARDVEIKNM